MGRYGNFWYGRPNGFLYKKQLNVGLRKSSYMIPGNEQSTNIWTPYIPGASVLPQSISCRRACQRQSSNKACCINFLT